MTTIPQLASAMQQVLIEFPDSVARSSGFTRRAPKLSASSFVQTCVFGWLSSPTASLDNLAQTAGAPGVAITAQGLDTRFTPQAATLLQQVLGAVVSKAITAQPVLIPLLQRFTAVYLLDSSTILLPDALRPEWAGCGGDSTQAALKVQVRLDLCRGQLNGPQLQSGTQHDAKAQLASAAMPAGALRIADLGYFSLEAMADISSHEGYWFSRLHARPKVYTTEGAVLDVCRWLGQLREEHREGAEIEVLLGALKLLPARLLALQVPAQVAEHRRRRLRTDARKKGQSPSSKQLAWADWTLYVTNVYVTNMYVTNMYVTNMYVTNVPQQLLSLQEAGVLGKAPWQIELLFKQWESDRQVDEWRSAKPWRILCEVYAKLIGSVVTHWLTVIGCWASPNRSMRKAGQAVQLQALHLASCLSLTKQLVRTITGIQRSLQAGCRLNKRRRHPDTFQLLLDPALLALA